MRSRLALREEKAGLSFTIQGNNPLGRGDGLEIDIHGTFLEINGNLSAGGLYIGYKWSRRLKV